MSNAAQQPSASIETLIGSTSPGAAPIFKPDVHVSAYCANILQRSPEERLLDLNRRYEKAIAFYYAAGDAHDNASGDEQKKTADTAVAHAVRILKEIQMAAYLVPARTPRELALKARIASWAKSPFWNDEANEQDADLRFLIEDALAMGGLDRIHVRDFEFSELLPGYKGPRRHEPTIEAAAPQFGEKPIEPPSPMPGSIHAFGVEAQALWECKERLDDLDSPDNLDVSRHDVRRKMDAVNKRIETIESQVSYMPVRSLADLMFQIAMVGDQVDVILSHTTADFDHATADNYVDRILSSIMTFLMSATGLTMKDVGADAYMAITHRFVTRDLAQLDQHVFGLANQKAAA